MTRTPADGAGTRPDPTSTGIVARMLARAGFVREGVLRSFLHVGDRRSDAVVCSRVAEDLDAAS